ncbi:MAG: segregation/condensation protein A, partial [Clostridia bacterium]|nr:segregation/condensation protein A [Clostridia bacterium]
MEQLLFKLPVFEGPLDLLLHLILKNKLNICDISISELLEQYMATIEEMKRQDMDIESSFFEMAARLVYIKTVMLLPKHEEAEKAKQELEGQLIQYELCKKIAKIMSGMVCFDEYV